MRRAKGKKIAWGWTEANASFLEYNGVNWGVEGRAFYVVLEFVFPSRVGAPKFAFTYLGLGSSWSDPCIAPGSEDAGGNCGGGSLSNGYGSFELVVKDIFFFASFGCIC